MLRTLVRRLTALVGTEAPVPDPVSSRYPDWRTILERDADRWAQARATGPRVLLATSVGGHVPMVTVESTLALALTARGAWVEILLCDEALPACMQAESRVFPDVAEYAAYGPRERLCRSCYNPGRSLYDQLGLTVRRYSQLLTADDRAAAADLSTRLPVADIPAYRQDGVAVGEHALAGALRFFARGNLDGEPYGEPVLRRYFHAALLTTAVARRLIDRRRYDVACFHHGIYVPQGLIGEVSRAAGVRVVNWNPAYRKHCFIFSHNDTYHRTLLDEPTGQWDGLVWTDRMEADILAYLKSRWSGSRDWIWFHERPEADLAAIAAQTGVDFSRPCIGLLTNVVFDAQLHYRTNAFPGGMLEWVLRTIKYFAGRPDLQLLIRVHPAEIRGLTPSRQPIVTEIAQAFPTIPPNVFVIGPESQVSTYAAMAACNSVLIYGTKTGVELTSVGIPVVVAGEAWIRNKGLTADASSPEEYFRLLDGLPMPGRMSDEQTRRARKYAYHFFFRRMIPLPFIVPGVGGQGVYKLNLARLDDLLPGRSCGLDVICDGILRGDEFIYPMEVRPGGAGEE